MAHASWRSHLTIMPNFYTLGQITRSLTRLTGEAAQKLKQYSKLDTSKFYYGVAAATAAAGTTVAALTYQSMHEPPAVEKPPGLDKLKIPKHLSQLIARSQTSNGICAYEDVHPKHQLIGKNYAAVSQGISNKESLTTALGIAVRAARGQNVKFTLDTYQMNDGPPTKADLEGFQKFLKPEQKIEISIKGAALLDVRKLEVTSNAVKESTIKGISDMWHSETGKACMSAFITAYPDCAKVLDALNRAAATFSGNTKHDLFETALTLYRASGGDIPEGKSDRFIRLIENTQNKLDNFARKHFITNNTHHNVSDIYANPIRGLHSVLERKGQLHVLIGMGRTAPVIELVTQAVSSGQRPLDEVVVSFNPVRPHSHTPASVNETGFRKDTMQYPLSDPNRPQIYTMGDKHMISFLESEQTDVVWLLTATSQLESISNKVLNAKMSKQPVVVGVQKSTAVIEVNGKKKIMEPHTFLANLFTKVCTIQGYYLTTDLKTGKACNVAIACNKDTATVEFVKGGINLPNGSTISYDSGADIAKIYSNLGAAKNFMSILSTMNLTLRALQDRNLDLSTVDLDQQSWRDIRKGIDMIRAFEGVSDDTYQSMETSPNIFQDFRKCSPLNAESYKMVRDLVDGLGPQPSVEQVKDLIDNICVTETTFGSTHGRHGVCLAICSYLGLDFMDKRLHPAKTSEAEKGAAAMAQVEDLPLTDELKQLLTIFGHKPKTSQT